MESDQDLLYQYKVAWAFSQASEEILAFVEDMKQTEEALIKKQNGETINKLREAVS